MEPTVTLTLVEATFISQAIEADDGSIRAAFKRGQAFECISQAILTAGVDND